MTKDRPASLLAGGAFLGQNGHVYLPEPVFREIYDRHLHSAEWEAFRKNVIISLKARCAICGLLYKSKGGHITVDHKRYWADGDLIFGREQLSDVRLLCSLHHGRGVSSDLNILMRRVRFLIGRSIIWTLKAAIGRAD